MEFNPKKNGEDNDVDLFSLRLEEYIWPISHIVQKFPDPPS